MWINVVEDEKALNSLLVKYLENEGYHVRGLLNGEEAKAVLSEPAVLWVIDIMLPDTNGFTLFNEVKQKNPHTFVIFISARNQDVDRVAGLEFGCDDYISKPFLARELVIKVNRLLQKNKAPIQMIPMGDYQIWTDKHRVEYQGQVIELTVKEYDLLFYLFHHVGIVLDREHILTNIWGRDYYGSDRVVDDTVRRLRNKLPLLDIRTVYGMGYCYKEKDE